MIYYRQPAGLGGGRPPELVGYTSTGRGFDLTENTEEGFRILCIVPPFGFDPPADGTGRWLGICEGWQAAVSGPFDPRAHVRAASPWKVAKINLPGHPWYVPHVLTPEGVRAFKVAYGGAEFSPQLTPEQASALALATEVRQAIDAGTLPDMPIQARWAAQLLPLVYHLSPATLAMVGLPEDLIDTTLRVAAGHYAVTGESP